MAEYIDRGTAITKLTALEVTEPNATMADAKRVLADMQTADVASVVRCKNCSWYQSVDDDGDDFEVCNYYNREVMGYQFCSEAEPYKTPEEKAEFRRSVGLDEGAAMAEYINRKALLQKAWDADTRIGYVQVVDVGDILDMPVADVAPVVHGRWEYIPQTLNTLSQFRCPFCRWWSLDPSIDGAYNYCPNCGAKMDEKEATYD